MYLHYAVFLPVDWHSSTQKEKPRMRHLAIGVLLACMLSGTARAGEIPSTGVVAPQPSSSAGVTGEIPTTVEAVAGEIHSTGGDSTTVLTIVLTLLSIVR
jgi:hypothetical protein